jgi:FkbM family methyltransferase
VRALLNAGVGDTGPRVVEVAAGPARGLRLFLDLSEEKYYWLGSHEPEVWSALARHLRDGDVVYDVGAHVGYWAPVAGRTVGARGRVHAFEADPGNAQRLERNVRLNSMGGVVRCHRVAIGDTDREATLMLHTESSMHRLREASGRAASFTGEATVRMRSIDSLISLGEAEPPDLVKMDIEGGEVLAFEGMRSLLADRRPILLVETHGHGAHDAVVSAMRTNGYRLWRAGAGAHGHVLAVPSR